MCEVAGTERLARKVVIDVGNGSAGRVFRRLADRLKLEAVILNEEPDGRFPNRNPNPLRPESRQGAARKVREIGADVAALLDGDGDRVVFLDERGEAVENYFIAALIAEELLAHRPGGAVVYDLISSRALPERIRELGGKPVVSKVGYTFLYDAMVAEAAVFGAETSGHVYFKVTDRFYTESAAYALVVLLKLLAKRGRRLSELVAPLAGRYVQSDEINVEIRDKEAALARVEKHFAASGARLDRLDGIGVEFDDCWFNIRASNTEPLLRVQAGSREPGGPGAQDRGGDEAARKAGRAEAVRIRYNAPVDPDLHPAGRRGARRRPAGGRLHPGLLRLPGEAGRPAGLPAPSLLRAGAQELGAPDVQLRLRPAHRAGAGGEVPLRTHAPDADRHGPGHRDISTCCCSTRGSWGPAGSCSC